MRGLLGEYAVEYLTSPAGSLLVTQEGLLTRFRCSCPMKTSDVLRLVVYDGNRDIMMGVLMPKLAEDSLEFDKKYSKNDLKQMGLEDIKNCRIVGKEHAKSSPPKPSPPPVMPVSKPEPLPIPTPKPEPPPAPQPKPIPAPIPTPPPEPVPAPISAPLPSVPPSVPPPIIAAPNSWNTLETPSPAPAVQDDAGWTAVFNPGVLFADAQLKTAAGGIAGAISRQKGKILELAIPFEVGKPFPLMPIFCLGRWDEIDGITYLIFSLEDGVLM